jgi:hypothetical protein
MYCGSGCAEGDPWILIEAFGGPKRSTVLDETSEKP